MHGHECRHVFRQLFRIRLFFGIATLAESGADRSRTFPELLAAGTREERVARFFVSRMLDADRGNTHERGGQILGGSAATSRPTGVLCRLVLFRQEPGPSSIGREVGAPPFGGKKGLDGRDAFQVLGSARACRGPPRGRGRPEGEAEAQRHRVAFGRSPRPFARFVWPLVSYGCSFRSSGTCIPPLPA